MARSTKLRGSGMVMAVVFSAILCIMLASMLKWVLTEASINRRTMLNLEARNAAEAVAEYGFVQIHYQMDNTATFLANAFTSSGAHPLSLPPTSLFAGTHVDTSSISLKGGTMTSIITAGSTSLYYIDQNDPNHANDPLKGKWVFRRDVPVYSKVTVLVPNGPAINAYVREKISVRGAPLFAHALFYNMDMEISPGSTMTINGPVHVNGDIYMSSQGTALHFDNTVTCTGNIYHAWKSYLATAQGQTNGTTGETLGMSADVTFKTRTGNLSMDATGQWNDSTMGVSTTIHNNNASYTTQASYTKALSDAAAQTVVATTATGNTTSFKNYASQTWNGNVQTSANGVQNYTPVAIGKYAEDTSPTDGTDQSVNTGRLLIEPPTPSTSTDYSAEVEAQKYSNQAGLYIKIVPASGSVSSTTTTGSGNSTITTTVNNPAVGAIVTVRVGGPTGTIAASVPTGLVQYVPYQEKAVTTSSGTTNSVSGGLYDQRRGVGEDIVEFDMAKLKDVVAQMQLSSGSRDATKAISSLETTNWTGIVYLEVTGNPTTRLDGSTVAAVTGNKVAIRLNNGGSPVASYGTGDTRGLTIATNAPLYIKGNYNDTGSTQNSSTSSTSYSGENPAAIAADSVTILSAGFNEATSKSSPKQGASANIVVAAAILSGITPTNKDGSARMSGGAHNFVRFLEDWGSKSVYIRGSNVALFESRVATEPWRIDYYGAPARNWGFDDLFQAGHFPPGTPRVISYRRTDYNDLTKAEYDTATAGL